MSVFDIPFSLIFCSQELIDKSGEFEHQKDENSQHKSSHCVFEYWGDEILEGKSGLEVNSNNDSSNKPKCQLQIIMNQRSFFNG